MFASAPLLRCQLGLMNTERLDYAQGEVEASSMAESKNDQFFLHI